MKLRLQGVRGETAWVNEDHVTCSNFLKAGRDLVKKEMFISKMQVICESM